MYTFSSVERLFTSLEKLLTSTIFSLSISQRYPVPPSVCLSLSFCLPFYTFLPLPINLLPAASLYLPLRGSPYDPPSISKRVPTLSLFPSLHLSPQMVGHVAGWQLHLLLPLPCPGRGGLQGSTKHCCPLQVSLEYTVLLSNQALLKTPPSITSSQTCQLWALGF